MWADSDDCQLLKGFNCKSDWGACFVPSVYSPPFHLLDGNCVNTEVKIYCIDSESEIIWWIQGPQILAVVNQPHVHFHKCKYTYMHYLPQFSNIISMWKCNLGICDFLRYIIVTGMGDLCDCSSMRKHQNICHVASAWKHQAVLPAHTLECRWCRRQWPVFSEARLLHYLSIIFSRHWADLASSGTILYNMPRPSNVTPHGPKITIIMIKVLDVW